jgi:hypothetical protein
MLSESFPAGGAGGNSVLANTRRMEGKCFVRAAPLAIHFRSDYNTGEIVAQPAFSKEVWNDSGDQ